MKSFLLFFLSLSICAFTYGQGVIVKGKIVDANDTSSLIGVTVLLKANADTSNKTGTVTDENGQFEIDNVAAGTYTLQTFYLGYKSYSQTIIVSGENYTTAIIKMRTADNELKNVVVNGKQVRAQQLGDTSQFNADAYKTHPDATAEDLVTKMPGVTSDNNGVKVNGEAVQQVYVDGKPFLGTDPTAALKNLPAEVIDKIQVFDKLSDQSTFTGFDDGSAQKTINIVTKKNKNNGQFGKVYAGYGTDDRYLAGASINAFDGDRRITLIGLTNNVNQQNFSASDILGASGGSGSNRGGSSGGGGRGSFGGGGGGAGNFLVGQQGGITLTNSVGLNYSDNWGKKIKVSGSYFFNSTDNINNTQLERDYFTKADSSLRYDEKDHSETKNINHRFNLRLEYNIDSFNAIIFTPNLSVQQNNASTLQTDSSFIGGLLSSNAMNATTINNSGYNSSGNLLFQHKFHKRGRTISLNVGGSLNEKTGNGTYNSLTDYYSADTSTGATTNSLLDHHYDLYNNAHTISSNITYTEPIGIKSQLMVNYSPSYTKSRANKDTYNRDGASKEYTDFDSTLSNRYDNTYITQRGGLTYRLGDKKLNFSLGANIQYATLDGNQYFPSPLTVQKTFTDVLPQGMFNYRFADGRNLRIMYRASTTPPSITQLQNVVDVTNPLLLKTGNPDLRQDYEHNVTLRYGLTKSKTAHNFFVFALANYINNYIGNATYIPTKDSSLSDGIKLNRGSQLTKPVNLNGYFNDRLFLTYGLPVDIIKSNLNLNGGISYTRTPGAINDVINYSNSYTPTFGAVVSSNISENLDFTLSYSGNYNVVKNTVETQGNNNYYNHTAAFKINWIFLKGVVLNTNITHTYYSTLTGTSPNESFLLWNAYVAYKFLKSKALEARISAFDILNQNKSISRTVTDTYIENSTTEVLKQYFMFQLTYTLRNFKAGSTMPQDDPNGGRTRNPNDQGPGGRPGGHGGNMNNGGPGGF